MLVNEFLTVHRSSSTRCSSARVADLCAIDQPLCQDENSLLSFEALHSIHKMMDDDGDGTVDMMETDEVGEAQTKTHKKM